MTRRRLFVPPLRLAVLCCCGAGTLMRLVRGIACRSSLRWAWASSRSTRQTSRPRCVRAAQQGRCLA
jgi:hypothetical protein|eukprot:COSAG01_NODE_3710_length_5770_cov_10.433962_8_plen_67_part_00